ncbi:YesL family protein [Cellulomonas soli]|uniref:DUF624 domain-containing protein n=1 Tax=Cellulomonas soli TaxID=931535 RepID=A0A512PIT8_9CELL|nr:YesL family protein [Cellulomonas soli]NYI58852.1 putative membrane protein YesL [Cellulomonas soli]GEP71093.1 hypothetical protein CSO01_38080 [Cellulomonas soli]
MRIDPNSRNIQGITSFLTFVALNVLYLLTCLPVVTIGVATSALYEVTIRYSDDERGRPLKDYLLALRANVRRATLVYLALVVPAGVLLFSGVFWLSSGSSIGAAAATIAFLASAYLLAAFLFGMALVAQFDTGVRRTVRNALLLPAAEPVRTFGIVLIPVTVVAVTIVFPTFLVVLVTVAFSVGAYASAFLFRGVFARHAG